jgi:hypothetical protein
MKRLHISISVLLLGLFVMVPLLHATHTHGAAEHSGSDAVSSTCAVCASGTAFDAHPVFAGSNPALAAPQSVIDSDDPISVDTLPQTAADPRAPPISFV